MLTVPCPSCGRVVERAELRVTADAFCEACDFPLFWATGIRRNQPGATTTADQLVITRSCSRCDAAVPEGAEFCPQCGFDQLGRPEPAEAVAVAVAPAAAPVPRWLPAAVAALGLLALLAGVLVATRSDAGDPASGVPAAARAQVQGYWLAGADGGVFTFGGISFGGRADEAAVDPVVDVVANPVGDGYWLVRSGGAISAHAGAPALPAARMPAGQAVVGMTATSTGRGAWLAAASGVVAAVGDARPVGSLGGVGSAAPVVGLAAAPAGGLWLAGADGQVYALGGAPAFGSAAGRASAPIAGIGPSPSGAGYLVVSEKGEVFAFGPGADSLPPADNPSPLLGRVVALGVVRDGYAFVSERGEVRTAGFEYKGDAAGFTLHAPVVALALRA